MLVHRFRDHAILIFVAAFNTIAAGTGDAAPRPDAPSTLLENHATAAQEPQPEIRLVPIEGFEDENNFLHSINDRIARLIERADAVQVHTAADAMQRVDRYLAAANLLLAYRLEPACSRRLLRLAESARPKEPETTHELLDRADRLLAKAGDWLDEIGDDDQPPEEWREQTSAVSVALRAFAGAIRAFLLPADEEDAPGRARMAAIRLAPLLEDPDPSTAAAARLWQASLRARALDVERALTTLDLALAEPREQTMPYAFFLRLLRCQLLAERGGYAAAVALLMQMEERTHQWFTSVDNRAAAVRAISLVHVQILSEWRDALPTGDAEEQRRWCADRIASIRDLRFGDDRNTVLRLGRTIPILASPGEFEPSDFDASP